MYDESQGQGSASSPTGDPAEQGTEATAPSSGSETTAAPTDPAAAEVSEEPTPEPQPQAGGDVSTAPPTASPPPPGVPASPVNAEAKDGDVPGPRMEPGRIGEAQRAAEAAEAEQKSA